MNQEPRLEEDPLFSEMQRELNTSRQILKAIFDSVKSSIFLIAPDFSITFFNQYAYDGSKFLYGRELFVGDSILNYRREGDEGIFLAFRENFDRALATNSTVVSEREMHYPQLSFWVRTEYTPVLDDGKPVGVLLHAQDITERKKMECSCQEKQEQLNQIAWSQSHETRQPLATMLGLVNILDKESLTPENKEIINLLVETALKLERVIQQNVIRASGNLFP